MTKEQVFGLLQETALFQDCALRDLEAAFQNCEILEFPEGVAVINEGDENHALYVVLEGCAEVLLPERSPDIQRISPIHLRTLNVGDYFGEYSLLDAQPASASVIAQEPTRVLRLTQRSLGRLAHAGGLLVVPLYRNLARLCVQRLREKDEELDVVARV